jgi:predicted ATPase/class 3 adenylate cyclase
MSGERSLPTGTVTFLFSDIEGSTRLVQQLGEDYAPLLERHQAILRSVFARHDGTEVGTEGDSFFVVFPSAPEAVAAAAEGQRELEAYPWPQDARIRVRMGLHTGAGILGGDNYVGVDLHRAARITAVSHGGQILISNATQALIASAPPDGIVVRDLGSHRLKDLLAQEHIFQVSGDGLADDFPPLATLTSRPNNLPTQASTFLGRDEEMASVSRALTQEDARLVTLVGPGGIGKTRLALQAAAELADHFVDGVYFVDLSPVRDADTAFDAIARAIDAPRIEGSVPDGVAKALEGRLVLLVLDNLEQVIDVANEIVGLVQACARLHVIVTSRESLRVRGERLIQVPPLGLPSPTDGASDLLHADAVHLFLERARASQPDLRLGEDDHRAIAEICVRLDGLPLAIELAAARLSLFSPAELRDRLHGRLDALGTGARDLPDRQRTIRSAIEWSYELLDDDDERAIFRLFSVFTTAQPAAVEAVGNDVEGLATVDVLGVLESLMDKSLIRPSEGAGDRRLEMLQTIREYATERLGEDPLHQAIERAHAEHFARFALSVRDLLDGSERAVTLARIESDLGNLMTAWGYWLREGDLERLDMLLDPLWILFDSRGRYQGAVELSNGLLGVLDRIPSSTTRASEEITVRTGLARALMAIRGYTQEVEDAYNRALALAGETGGLPERVPVLRSLSSLYLYRGDFERSVEKGRQLLRIAKELDDKGLQAEGHLRVGACLVSLGETEAALDHLARASALFDPERQHAGRFRLGPSTGVTSHTTPAFVLWLTGNADQARAHAAAALEVADLLGEPYTLAYARFHVGMLTSWEGRWDRVEELAAGVLRIADEHDYHVWHATALVLRGTAASAEGRFDEGLAATEQGLALYQEMTAPPIFWPLLLSLRARSLAFAGKTQDALAVVDEAIPFTGGPPNVLAPQFPVLRGDLLAALGDNERAQESYRAAIEIAAACGARMNDLQARIGLVRVATEPERGASIDGLRQVYETFTEGFDVPPVAEARTVLGL